jgi:hypothetical protein
MKYDLSQLLLDIQIKSNINVKEIKDLKFLGDDIKYNTKTDISFNTLRRLYGFLPRTNFSKKTLDTLSRYLGFNSYSSYLNNKKIYNIWYFKMKFLELQNNYLPLSLSDISLFNLKFQNSSDLILISEYIGYLIEKKKTDSLILFFKNFQYKKLSDASLVMFATIITFSFYKLKDKLELYKELVFLDSFRYSVPFFYVDYRHLNGYYFEVLKDIKKLNKHKSEVFFVELMGALKKFYGNQKISRKKITPPENSATFPPVLIGRYFGYLILYETVLEISIKEKINEYLTKTDSQQFLIEIVPALIIKEEFNYLQDILDKYYEDIFIRNNWTSDGTIINFLIGLANVNIFKNNFDKAKLNLEFVELEKIELGYKDYITLFYYLTWLKIMCYEKNQEQIDHYYTEIKLLANKIGFFKFIEIADKFKKN